MKDRITVPLDRRQREKKKEKKSIPFRGGGEEARGNPKATTGIRSKTRIQRSHQITPARW